MNDAAMAPPGVMPSQQPITDERTSVIQYFGRSFHTLSTTRRLMAAAWPRSASRSSMVSRISLMPNRPITATRKLMPRSRSLKPNVMRKRAGHRVHADAGQQQAERHRDDGLVLVLAAEADERAERQQIDREELRRPEAKRERGDAGRQERDQQHRDQRADERRGERRRQRLGGAALLRHRIAVEGGGDRPGLARNVEQDRGDGAAEQRAPVDARQHDDGRGRVHREGERQQDGDAVRPAEPRQHADENAEDQPDHHQRQRLPRHQDGEAVEQQAEGFHQYPKAASSGPFGMMTSKAMSKVTNIAIGEHRGGEQRFPPARYGRRNP